MDVTRHMDGLDAGRPIDPCGVSAQSDFGSTNDLQACDRGRSPHRVENEPS